MKKIDLLYGVLIGIIATFVGTFLFIAIFTDYDYFTGIKSLKAEEQLGKLITLGAILNIVIFFILLKINKELMARGVVLATILITIITLFV